RERANYLLLADGRGGFEDLTEGSGLGDGGGCDSAIAGDLDGDGGMDIVILSYGSPPELRFNRLHRGSWLGVVVEGRVPATDAIGARVGLRDAVTGEELQVRWSRRGRGFGSTGPAELRFGLGHRARVDVEVLFADGSRRRVRGARAGTTVLVREDGGSMSSLLGRLLAERRFAAARGFRRSELGRPPLAWLIALLALPAGFAAAVPGRARPAAWAYLVAGGVAAAFLGSVPGRGIGGSPLSLWTLGTAAGMLAPATRAARRRLGRHLGRRAASPPSLEHLVRASTDFRHAGVETRVLLAFESRLTNLFRNGDLDRRFHARLGELTQQLSIESGPRIRHLLELVAAALPEIRECSGTTELVQRAEVLSRRFPSLGDDAGQLEAWRSETLPTLRQIRLSLARILERVDLLCSCDVGEAVREICHLRSAACRDAGIDLELVDDGPVDDGRPVEDSPGPLRGRIPKSQLLLILENLFANSAAAFGDSREKRIIVTVASEADRIHLCFRDTGPGIPPGLEEKIFETGLTSSPVGGGYGLPRSREILEHFGGSITLDSHIRQGAAFVIVLQRVGEGTGRS
ncbi:MAG: ATP-binding protein, partial [Holophagales bacterium]|nr:ATP-binding protein [Holophagales bacterium]